MLTHKSTATNSTQAKANVRWYIDDLFFILNYFDKFDKINYLEFDNFEANKEKILVKLGLKEKVIDY